MQGFRTSHTDENKRKILYTLRNKFESEEFKGKRKILILYDNDIQNLDNICKIINCMT